jgi:hypothetical protein
MAIGPADVHGKNFLARVTHHRQERVVGFADISVKVRRNDSDDPGLRQPPKSPLASLERPFSLSLLRLISKDQDHSAKPALRVPDGRPAIGDGSLAAVARHQNRVVGEPDHDAFAKHAVDGTLHGVAGCLIDDVKDLGEGSPPRLRVGPTRKRLRPPRAVVSPVPRSRPR